MARVLLANELGMPDVHVRRLAALAQALRAHGHDPVLALPDLAGALPLLADTPLRALPAPVQRATVAGLPPVHTYTDLMLRHGYVNVPTLWALARGWRDLVELLRPDLVLLDHAPVAALATRRPGLPRLRVGDGTGCPPLATPMPPMTWWHDAAEPFDDIAERNVLHVANQVAAELGLAPAETVAELLQADGDALCTLPELDPYPGRSAAAWCGPLVAARDGLPLPWPEGEGPCAYVALSRRHPLLQPVVAALREAGVRVVVQLSQASPELARTLSAPGVVVAPDAVPAAQLREGCRFAVLDGRPHTTQGLLLHGKPLLLLPQGLEQQMLARRVQAQGLGLWLDAAAADAAPALPPLIGSLRDDPAHADAAQAFARRHLQQDDARTLRAVMARVDTVLATG